MLEQEENKGGKGEWLVTFLIAVESKLRNEGILFVLF